MNRSRKQSNFKA